MGPGRYFGIARPPGCEVRLALGPFRVRGFFISGEDAMEEKLVVAPHGSAWEVRTEKSGRFRSIHKTKNLAVTAAGTQAKKKHTTIIVRSVQQT